MGRRSLALAPQARALTPLTLAAPGLDKLQLRRTSVTTLPRSARQRTSIQRCTWTRDLRMSNMQGL